MKTIQTSLLVLFCTILQGQENPLKELPPPPHIKTVIFKGPDEGIQFPLITLTEKALLTFDDLYADEQDYYYRIQHCNFDWTPSNLPKNRYLQGVDNLRITRYTNSVATLQPYTHYQLQIPNADTGLLITGNYMLTVTDSKNREVFSRKFIVYSNQAAVGLQVKRARDFSLVQTHQRLDITVGTADISIPDPRSQIMLCLMQNSHFPSAITNLKPQFISGNSLVYRYDSESAFPGGNEYRFFDTKEIRLAVNSIASSRIENERYHHRLYTDIPRSNQVYTFLPDINGDFEVSTLDAPGNSVGAEADYSFVWFTLDIPPDLTGNKYFVYGKFNNYEVLPENELTYNDETKRYEAPVLLKQGIYNYKYVTTNNMGEVQSGAISGNFWPTENEYLALVYFRDFGGLYDKVIGIGTASSSLISN